MQAVKASVILEDAYKLMRWDPDQLEDREKAEARNGLSNVLQEVWEAWWWADLMQCDLMQFAPDATPQRADGNSYAEDDVVYYSSQGKYYLMIGDDQDGPPFENGAIKSSWTEWSPTPTTTEWSDVTQYAIRDRVVFGTRTYEAEATPPLGEIPGTGNSYQLLPDWQPTVPYYNYATVPVLVGARGEVRTASRLDPRTTPNPTFYQTEPTDDGTRILELDVGLLWIWARRRTPILTGDDYSTTATYEATDPFDLVFDA